MRTQPRSFFVQRASLVSRLLLLQSALAFPALLTRRGVLSMAAAPNTVAVVTGSNKGIGYEIIKKVAPQVGVAVLATRNEELGKAAAARLRDEGLGNVVFKQLDLASPESIAKFVDGVKQDYGFCSILVNNGAIAFKARDPTPFRDQAEPTFKINFWGTVDLTEKMLPLLKASPTPPRVVSVASMAGHLRILRGDAKKQAEVSSAALGKPRLFEMMKEFEEDVKAGRHQAKGWPSTCYGMSKLGVIAYTRVLAREEGPGLWVAACCPGYCSTDMSSHGGTRSAEHGARTPAWLALGGGNAEPGGFYQDEREIEW